MGGKLKFSGSDFNLYGYVMISGLFVDLCWMVIGFWFWCYFLVIEVWIVEVFYFCLLFI